MADPDPYEVAYSFANFQAQDPLTPLPGVQVDNELAGVETAIGELIDAVKDVRRSDGALKNAIVTTESLSPELLAGLGDFDAEAAAAVAAAIAAVQASLEADLDAGLATKSDVGHGHAATEITVSAISGLVAATVQAALAEIIGYLPKPGDLQLAMDPTARTGWRLCDDGTIGQVGSGATFASALAWPLYNVLWTNVSNTYAPVTTGRGLTAAADFAALKPIALTKMLGRALAIAGSGSGLSARSIGQTAGAETVSILTANLPNVALPVTVTITDPGHTHNFIAAEQIYKAALEALNSAYATRGIPAPNDLAYTGITAAGSVQLGSGTALANVQPTAFVYCFLKL